MNQKKNLPHRFYIPDHPFLSLGLYHCTGRLAHPAFARGIHPYLFSGWHGTILPFLVLTSCFLFLQVIFSLRSATKKELSWGLVLWLSGCLLFYPAASYRVFGIFMLAVFVLAGGITVLAGGCKSLCDDPRARKRLLRAGSTFHRLSIPSEQ